MATYKCQGEGCDFQTSKRKEVKKVRKKWFCKCCYKKNRKERRKETLNNSPDKERIMEIQREKCREYYKKNKKEVVPKIKGSTEQKKQKSESFLTFSEKQVLLRIFMDKGMKFEEAKERIMEIIEEQSRVRKLMKKQKRPEEEIKIKQREMLEELWRT